MKTTALEIRERLEVSKIKESLEKITRVETSDIVSISAEKLDTVIGEMLSVIDGLESQLKDALEIAAALRVESRDKDSHMGELKRNNEDLQFKLSRIEKNTTLAEEIEKRFELVVEEMEKYKSLYRNESTRAQACSEEISDLKKILRKTTEERDDAYREIVLLANKAEAANGK